MNQPKSKSRIGLVVSIIVTAVIIVAWHFVAASLTEITDVVKFVSYAILMLGMTWILSCAFKLSKDQSGETPEVQILALQNRLALTGMVTYLLYSALVHAVVGVLFDGGKNTMMVVGIEKCAIALIGYCLFMMSALHITGKKTMLLASYVIIFAAGIVLSMFLNGIVTSVILLAITLALFLIDAVSVYGNLKASPSKFITKQIGFMAIISVVMIIRFLTPINFGGNVFKFVLSGIINLIVAVVIDIVLLAVMKKSSGKKAEDESKKPVEAKNEAVKAAAEK